MRNAINLIYLSPWNIGGFASFTTHLYFSLIKEGIDVTVLRCNRDRHENNPRELKHHKMMYQNVTVSEALKATRQTPTLVTAVATPEHLAAEDTIPRLLKAGAKICVQSAQEFKQFPHTESLRKQGDKVITIRQSLVPYFKGSQFLPHPYVKVFDELPSIKAWARRTRRACSLAMIATNKHPDILCEANKILSAKEKIRFLGKETTHFLRMHLMEKYSDTYKPALGFSGSKEAVLLAEKYQINVDLSDYKGEGGGTQYSFLEAMDAGCINIAHDNWLAAKGDMQDQYNCIGVIGHDDLARLIKNVGSQEYKLLREGMTETLEDHSPSKIVQRLRNIM